MSYRKKHVKSKIHKIRHQKGPQKRIFKRRWFWIAVFLMVIFLSVIYYVLFYPGLQLENIIISGNERVRTQDLQNFVEEYTTTGLVNFWDVKIFSGSIFLINKDRIRRDVLEKFPDIEKLTIKKDLPQSIILSVTERKPFGVYCSLAGPCFLIDQNGVVFEPAEESAGGTIIVRQSVESKQVFTGEEAVAHNIMDIIYKIQNNLKDNFQIDLEEALITSPVRLNVTTNEGWKIYFDLGPDYDINAQITKLNLLLNGGMSGPGVPSGSYSSRQNLRYIDLRPRDRAIVCDNSTCGG